MFDIDNFFTKLGEEMSKPKNIGKAVELDAVIQMNISGPKGGNWIINASNRFDGPYCKRGTFLRPEDPDEAKKWYCETNISDLDFDFLSRNPQVNAIQLFFQAKMTVPQTDFHNVSLRLSKFFDIVFPEKAQSEE
jgi:hypothetical protein